MQDIQKIRNIIFDMDGTLADTAKVTILSCRRFAAEYGLAPQPDAHIAGCIGFANPEFYHKLYPGADHALLKKYGDDVEAYERELLPEFGADILFPGVIQTLNRLLQCGCRLFVASTGSEEHVLTTLRAAGITDLFTSIHFGQPVKIEMVGKLIAKGPAGDYLIVGDRSKDCDAGHGNGIPAVGARFGYGPEQELSAFDYTIDAFPEILELLGIQR